MEHGCRLWPEIVAAMHDAGRTGAFGKVPDLDAGKNSAGDMCVGKEKLGGTLAKDLPGRVRPDNALVQCNRDRCLGTQPDGVSQGYCGNWLLEVLKLVLFQLST